MKLISIGCSFLYGYYKRGEGCNKDYSAGYHLSNMMERDWLNESDCGIGNDLICERLMFIDKLFGTDLSKFSIKPPPVI